MARANKKLTISYMTDQNQQQQNQQIQVKISDDILKGTYANMMQVMHTKEEFVLDFMNLLPPNGIVSSRVIISPGHMKRIIAALSENMKNYEKAFGSITAAEEPKIGFKV